MSPARPLPELKKQRSFMGSWRRLTQQNFAKVAELEKVAQESGHSMAQVAINWVGNQPGVATVLVGATRQSQWDNSLASLDFELPVALRSRLDAVSAQVIGDAGDADRPKRRGE
jgi:aryl-alcohol dehydrogenase-like predicted oxidoreductase